MTPGILNTPMSSYHDLHDISTHITDEKHGIPNRRDESYDWEPVAIIGMGILMLALGNSISNITLLSRH